VTIAFVLVTAGILFKISAIPFHFWAADVYAAAPLPVIALFSTAPKIASLGLLWHLITAFGTVPSCFAWLGLVAASTLTLGNLAALGQQNFRKLMAWSSIGQGGFLISALLSGTEVGRDAALFYSLFYTLANVAVFELIRLAGSRAEHLPQLSGMGLQGRAALVWGILSVVALLSLVGLPPTGGFTAKFLVFTALLEQYGRGGNVWVMALLVLGLLNTVLALFYYLRIPYQLFLRPASASAIDNGNGDITLLPSLKANALVLFLCFLLVVGFLRADWLMTLLRIQLHQ
jgi:NADH-quinone oxidoreductase subunit N